MLSLKNPTIPCIHSGISPEERYAVVDKWSKADALTQRPFCQLFTQPLASPSVRTYSNRTTSNLAASVQLNGGIFSPKTFCQLLTEHFCHKFTFVA